MKHENDLIFGAASDAVTLNRKRDTVCGSKR